MKFLKCKVESRGGKKGRKWELACVTCRPIAPLALSLYHCRDSQALLKAIGQFDSVILAVGKQMTDINICIINGS